MAKFKVVANGEVFSVEKEGNITKEDFEDMSKHLAYLLFGKQK